MKKIITPLLALALLASSSAFAGGIRGTIKGDDGTILAFASVFVKQTSAGAATDMEGRFELSLPPGQYDVLFQYLGYETTQRKIEVGSDFVEINIVLKTQVVVLQNVIIKAGKEDPAYTIMRKAIGKAKYHTQQLDSYTTRAYIKGKYQLRDYPWFAKKAIEKEGVKKDRVFISESVSDIKYTRPNKFEEKVIAIYSTGNDKNSPNQLLLGSFYNPTIAEFVSPLSPKSFSYYRFEYLGSFKDNQYEISKIKVTPRSKGDDVFEGTIFIVEEWWSIHSLDLKTTKLGVSIKVKQIYNPIEDKVWLPVSQHATAEGKILGFDFIGEYFATLKDYKITLNPDLVVAEMKVVDEKIEKEEAKKIEKKFSKKDQQIQERLASGKEVTNKELRQMVREYEKQEQKETKEPEVLSESTFTVDSAAYKKDSTFWSEIRPVALSKQEERGYQINDSISTVERQREEGDTLKSRKGKKGFSPTDLLVGNSYRINKTTDFRIHFPYGGFNTVEGFNLIYRTSLYKRWVIKDKTDSTKKPRTSRLEISPIARYAFSRQLLTGKLRVEYRNQNQRLTLEGGRYVEQFNSDEPIHSFVNTLTSLFSGDNWMKLYEQDFIDLKYRNRINDKFTITSSWALSRRHELDNRSDYTFFSDNKENYRPNAPVNVETLNTGFEDNTAFTGAVGIEARPWQKYRIRNGNKFRIQNSSPVLSFNYKKGFNGIFGSDVNYDLIEAGIRQQIKFGIRGTFDVNVKAGKFLNADKLYFMDYKHFLGNKTPIITTDPVGSFRLMDYYLYSTRDQFVSVSAHYHFRKFLITRIPLIRLMGVQENFFVNYLSTPSSKNFTEVGYGLDGILRIFRLEGAVAFSNGTYQDYGFRIGISSILSVNFGD
ncbi:MAG: carboxypeptidase-like regulatory domain-containing protein [Cyclobacteriaceae bacterium]|nr:carboxypeptidase-like regulatory domain-containing protein [Cyclobacteriaceae bacterium]